MPKYPPNIPTPATRIADKYQPTSNQQEKLQLYASPHYLNMSSTAGTVSIPVMIFTQDHNRPDSAPTHTSNWTFIGNRHAEANKFNEINFCEQLYKKAGIHVSRLRWQLYFQVRKSDEFATLSPWEKLTWGFWDLRFDSVQEIMMVFSSGTVPGWHMPSLAVRDPPYHIPVRIHNITTQGSYTFDFTSPSDGPLGLSIFKDELDRFTQEHLPEKWAKKYPQYGGFFIYTIEEGQMEEWVAKTPELWMRHISELKEIKVYIEEVEKAPKLLSLTEEAKDY